MVSRSELVNTQLLRQQAYQVHPEQRVDQVMGTDNTYMSAGPLLTAPTSLLNPSFWVLPKNDSRCPRPRLGLLSSDQDLGPAKLARSASFDRLRVPAGVSLVVSRGHGLPPSQRPPWELVLTMSSEDKSLLSPRDLASLVVSPWEEVPRARHLQWSTGPIASQLTRD